MGLNTKQEIRVNIITKYLSGEIHYKDAINSLEIKERQFRRLVAKFKVDGISSIYHGKLGQKPPNKTSSNVVKKIIELYKGRYYGLNLKHFIEKLKENQDLKKIPSYTTIRRILLEEKLLIPQMNRSRKSYPRRKRYEKEGLMVQIDGSHHHWIYGMLPICLTLAIDDATGKILAGKFTKTETTFAAMDVVKTIVKEKGIFQMLYSDRAGIYGGGKRSGYSNMNRSMRELGVIPIQASTPQGKGRVERCFRTLQSRLVNELRLENIKTIDEANEYFTKIYIDLFNERFGVEARSTELGYKPVSIDLNLNEIFSVREDRSLQPGDVINYKGTRYLIKLKNELKNQKQIIEVREYSDGRMEMFIKKEKVEYEVFDEQLKAA
jgi:hypothetical protein